MYETYGDPDDVQKTNLGDWADEFKALEDACAEVSLAQQSIEMQDAKLLPYIVIVASYGKAKEIEKNILQNAPAEIVKAYYYETYAFEKFNPELKWSLSSLVYYLGTVYDYYRINLSVNGQSLFDWYDSEGNQEEYDLPDFLIDVSDVLFTSFAKNVSGQSSYDKAKLLAIMQTYRNELSAEDKFLFKILDGNMNLYDGALKEFFTTEFGAKVNISTAAKLLVEAEQAYVQYAYLSTLEGVTQETLNSVKAQFKSAYESFLTEFNKLEGDDLTAFNDVLEEMKAYYQNVYDGLTA